jgi:signal transduction histidine kinase
VNLTILLLPLAGIGVLRVYESALVRQTESELVAQSAFVSASFKASLKRQLGTEKQLQRFVDQFSRPVDPKWLQKIDPGDKWRPHPSTLDLATDRVRKTPPKAEPATGKPNRIVAMVGKDISNIMQDAQVVTLAGIRVVDLDGRIIASTSNNIGMSLASWEEVQRALKGEHVSLLRQRISDEPAPPLVSISRGTRVRVYVATPILLNNRVLGAVVLIRTPANIGRALYAKSKTLTIAGLLLLGVILLVSTLTSLAISRPVNAVIEQTQRAIRGEKGAVVPLERPVTEEIAQLSSAVAGMAQILEQRADYIREFASHVSHEFKTPLTAIQGAVELLRDHYATMSEAERNRFLNNMTDDVERLDRLVHRLLELARADTMSASKECGDAKAVITGLQKRYRQGGHAITFSIQSDKHRVAMTEEILESIISNLIDNALQHAEGADISIATRNTKGMLQIIVEDNGPGISAANLAQIFDPFFTTAREQGGTGLGLSLVKSLLASHSGSVACESSSAGTRFTIALPLVNGI